MSRTVADIVVTEAPELETQLDRAVKTAIDAALKDGRQGVLVTRHDHCKFTVALTPEVRFGTTQARDLWEADLNRKYRRKPSASEESGVREVRQ